MQLCEEKLIHVELSARLSLVNKSDRQSANQRLEDFPAAHVALVLAIGRRGGFRTASIDVPEVEGAERDDPIQSVPLLCENCRSFSCLCIVPDSDVTDLRLQSCIERINAVIRILINIPLDIRHVAVAELAP